MFSSNKILIRNFLVDLGILNMIHINDLISNAIVILLTFFTLKYFNVLTICIFI